MMFWVTHSGKGEAGDGLEGRQEVWHVGCDRWAWHIEEARTSVT